MARWVSTKKDGEYIFIIRNLATITIHDDVIEVLTSKGIVKYNLFLSEPYKFVNNDTYEFLHVWVSNGYYHGETYLEIHTAAKKALDELFKEAKLAIFNKKMQSKELIDCINFKIGLADNNLIEISSDRFSYFDKFQFTGNYLYGKHHVLYIYDNVNYFKGDLMAQPFSILLLHDMKNTFLALLNSLKQEINFHNEN